MCVCSELKRRQKAEKKAQEKAEKEAAQAAKPSQASAKPKVGHGQQGVTVYLCSRSDVQ